MSDTQRDLIPKTMLILKSQASSLVAAETFLRNRGWKIYSTVNLKEALVQIVSQKPSYVLISMDHTNKKVRTLPKLITSAFPIITIVFAEHQTSASFKVLDETAADYRVYPPVTGPAIERCVNKYLKDQQTKVVIQENDSFRSENGGSPGNEFISIKGEVNGNLAVKVDHSLIFAQPLDEENPDFETHIKADQEAVGEDYHNLLAAKLQAKVGEANQQNGPSGFNQAHVQKGSSGIVGTYIEPLGGGELRPPYSGMPEGLAGESGGRQESGGPGTEAFLKKKGNTAPTAKETLIARGAQKSLEESVEAHDGSIADKIEVTTCAACIIVESDRFSGYLVAVMGNNRKIDQFFVESVKEKLFKFLKENGEQVAERDSLDIKIQQVDFEPWALDCADFLRKSVHQGSEVAMAFFPRRRIQVILEDSGHKDMAKVHLKEFKGDQPVEFDLFVFLPNNNKYVLYTPKGGVFYNEQMERLKNKGVTHMHVKRSAVAAMTKYQAQNYLNDLIDDYEREQE